MFKRGITLGELLTSSFTVLGCLIGFYVNTNVRLNALEINQKAQQENVSDTKASFKEMGDKLDNLNEKLNSGLNEIKVTLQNKQDRK